MAKADSRMAYFPKIAKVTPMSRNRALHRVNLAVHMGTGTSGAGHRAHRVDAHDDRADRVQ